MPGAPAEEAAMEYDAPLAPDPAEPALPPQETGELVALLGLLLLL